MVARACRAWHSRNPRGTAHERALRLDTLEGWEAHASTSERLLPNGVTTAFTAPSSSSLHASSTTRTLTPSSLHLTLLHKLQHLFCTTPILNPSTMTFGSREDRARQLAGRTKKMRISSLGSHYGIHNGITTADHLHEQLHQPSYESTPENTVPQPSAELGHSSPQKSQAHTLASLLSPQSFAGFVAGHMRSVTAVQRLPPPAQLTFSPASTQQSQRSTSTPNLFALTEPAKEPDHKTPTLFQHRHVQSYAAWHGGIGPNGRLVTYASSVFPAYATYFFSSIAAFFMFLFFSLTSLILGQPTDMWVSRFYSGGGGAAAPSSSKSSLNKIFDKYREDAKHSPDSVKVDGMMGYLKEIGVDIEGLESLAAQEIVQAPTMGEMTREGFTDGWSALG